METIGDHVTTVRFITMIRNCSLIGSKKLDFEDFSKIQEMVNKDLHKTKEGLDEILVIKNGMNRGRKEEKFDEGIKRTTLSPGERPFSLNNVLKNKRHYSTISNFNQKSLILQGYNPKNWGDDPFTLKKK